jgi:hypothetical protein
MSYTLQAIIAKKGILDKSLIEGASIVPLRQGYEMIPLTRSFIDKFQIPSLPLTDDCPIPFPESIRTFCIRLSKEQQLAYVEAELFGGAGTQASVVFNHGGIEFGPVTDISAINQALILLGVTKESFFDEFEALGLNHISK